MLNCCKGDVASQWEIAIFAIWGSKTPEPIELKFGMIDYVRDGTTHANFDENRLGEGTGQIPHLYHYILSFFY